MPDILIVYLVLAVFIVCGVQTALQFADDRKRAILALSISAVILTLIIGLDSWMRFRGTDTFQMAITDRVRGDESNHYSRVSEMQSEIDDLKGQLVAATNTIQTLQGVVSGINFDGVRGRFPVTVGVETPPTGSGSVSGVLSWDRRFGMALPDEQSARERFAVEFRAQGPGSAQTPAPVYRVQTIFGIVQAAGDRFTVTFKAKGVPELSKMVVTDPLNFPANTPITIAFDGDETQTDYTNEAVISRVLFQSAKNGKWSLRS